MAELARVLDSRALDLHEGPSARLAIDVLPEWLDARATVTVVLPRRVSCARCDGGGCDSCARSGAFRIEGDDDARRVTLTLPSAPAVVRLAEPLANAPFGILLVELRATTLASTFVTRPARPGRYRAWLAIALALAAAIVVWRCT